MAYLYAEEFTRAERDGKLFALNWPDWYFPVISLYGEKLALNHLIATKQIHAMQLHHHLDVASHYTSSVNQTLHIHVFHDEIMFSKFSFKRGEYDSMNVTESDQINLYCLKMALEGKRFSGVQLSKMLAEQISNKV